MEKENILQEIAVRTKVRVEQQKSVIDPAEIKTLCEAVPIGNFPFESALEGDDLSFICEVKKASPSKGIIVEDFNYVQIAKDYEEQGAAAISVLTEPFYFQGADSHLKEIAEAVSIPLLRKDFIVDDYMIYEAKILGASAVLLICTLLEKDILEEYINLAHSLGLSALVETHDEDEIETALSAGARVIGVNNRDLKTFKVDISLSEKLRPLVPSDKIFIAESGIRTKRDVKRMEKIGANAVLVGETLMKGKKLECLK